VWLLDEREGSTVGKIFVAAQSVATLRRIPSGQYRVAVQHGFTYLRTTGRFCHPSDSAEFQDSFAYTETPDRDGTVYQTFDITLHTVLGGTARTRPLRRSLPLEPDDTIPHPDAA
jgi:hypothetical protein